MHARVVEIQLKKERVDEAVRLWKESVAPEARKREGIRKAYWLVDRETGRARAVALFAERENLVSADHDEFYRRQVEKFKDLLEVPPVSHVYEVAVTAEAE